MNKFLLITFLSFTMMGFTYAAKPILIVVTNHASIGDTGKPTGYFLSEVAHPWHVFTEAGYEVEFASPQGGFAPMDPKSFKLEDPINKKFWHTLDAVQGLVFTFALGAVDPTAYGAISLSVGAMFDFPNADQVAQAISKHYRSGGFIGAVYHGPAALVEVEIDGKPLVLGKRIAAFTNEEEAAVKLTKAFFV